MRFRELLLEYEHEKTLARFGRKLFDRMLNDPSVGGAWMAFAGDTPTDVAPGFAIERALTAFESCFEGNEEYIPWALIRYIRGGIQRWEDLHRANDYISCHKEFRRAGYFKRNPEANAKWGDIGRIKTLSDFGEFIQSLSVADAISNSAKDRETEKRLFDSGDAILWLDTPKYKIVIPKTQEASCWFGRATQWCTAAKNNNQFHAYTHVAPREEWAMAGTIGHRNSELYIVLEKATNRRWQLLFGFDSQYMDENDREINWKNFPCEVFSEFDVSRIGFKNALFALITDPLPAELVRRLQTRYPEAVVWTALVYQRDAQRGFTRRHGVAVDRKEYATILLDAVKAAAHPQPRRMSSTVGEVIVYQNFLDFVANALIEERDFNRQPWTTDPWSMFFYYGGAEETLERARKSAVAETIYDEVLDYLSPVYAIIDDSDPGVVRFYDGNRDPIDRDFTMKIGPDIQWRGPPSAQRAYAAIMDAFQKLVD